MNNKRFWTYAVATVMIAGNSSAFGAEPISYEDVLRETLANSPGVMINRQTVVQQQGLLTSATGMFDWIVSGTASKEKSHSPVSMTMENVKEEVVYSLGIGRQLRNGIVVRSSVSAMDYQDELTKKTPVNNSDLSAEVVIPLLKGRGEKSAAASELAAESNLTAAEQSVVHEISGQLMTASDLYWQCLTAKEIVKLYENALDRDTRLVEVVELLVEGGELPRANLEQAKAKYYKSSVDLNNAQGDLYSARINLAAVMGRNPAEESPSPAGQFPPVIDDKSLSAEYENALITMALNNRSDYRASQTAINSQMILLYRSKNELDPKIDLTIRSGYYGLIESNGNKRYYRSLYDNLWGMNTYMGVSLELPIKNRAAEGNVVYYQSQVEKAEQTARALSLTIASEVRSATETLRRAINVYRLARLSAESYQVAVDYEDRKVRMGQTNLTSLIDMQDRYLEVRLAEKKALMNYAMALTELRYVTGSVFTGAVDSLVLDPAALLMLPDAH